MILRRAHYNEYVTIESLQRRAYAANRISLGVEPLPLQADYAEILCSHEVWLAEAGGEVQGVLIVSLRADDLLVWSVAVEPALQGAGIGARLIAFAERRARDSRRARVRLYTASQLDKNIAWYQRLGFVVERTEPLPDRVLVHLVKSLD